MAVRGTGELLARRLHRKLSEIPEIRELFIAEEREFAVLIQREEVLKGNASIVESSPEALTRLEREFAVPIRQADDLDIRKSIILARLRGHGVTTPEVVKNVARSFRYGEIDVIEFYRDMPYVVGIKFISYYGVPPNLQAFKDTLRLIFPAHLGLAFEHRYMTWGEREAYHYTEGEWAAKGLTVLQEMSYSEKPIDEPEII